MELFRSRGGSRSASSTGRVRSQPSGEISEPQLFMCKFRSFDAKLGPAAPDIYRSSAAQGTSLLSATLLSFPPPACFRTRPHSSFGHHFVRSAYALPSTLPLVGRNSMSLSHCGGLKPCSYCQKASISSFMCPGSGSTSVTRLRDVRYVAVSSIREYRDNG